MSTGGISSSRLSTTSTIISGRNQRAQRSHGIFAMPSTPMVTAEVGRIGFTNSQSWKAKTIGKEILEEREKVDVILRNWMIVFFSIAGVSLVIGGVGIFSVLKISIGERLYEIGLRKSMGASDGEIFLQFLIESITLSTIGAAIGGGLGVALVLAIGSNFPGGLPISMPGIMMAGSFAISIGLTAGLYPSLVASRLEPVEALRA